MTMKSFCFKEWLIFLTIAFLKQNSSEQIFFHISTRKLFVSSLSLVKVKGIGECDEDFKCTEALGTIQNNVSPVTTVNCRK